MNPHNFSIYDYEGIEITIDWSYAPCKIVETLKKESYIYRDVIKRQVPAHCTHK